MWKFILCSLLFFYHSICAEIFTVKPPEGFDALTGPRQAPVDIFYEGIFLLNMMATYTIDTIEFENPEQLARSVPNLELPELIAKSLSGSLDIHATHVCHSTGEKGCGKIDPEIAGVIFDEMTFRVWLFINPIYLFKPDPLAERFLPPASTRTPGLLQGLFATATGAVGDYQHDNWSFFGRTAAGWQESRLETNWNITKDHSLSFDSMLLANEVDDCRLAGGYLSSQYSVSRFTYSRQMLGVQIGSSENTLINAAQERTSPVDIYMPEPGIIEVYRDDRLIYSEQIGSGNQLIDTRSFPGGTYDIELVGRSSSGQELFRVKRVYVRRNRLPVSGTRNYFLEAGDITHRDNTGMPERTGNLIIRGGWEQGLSLTSALYSAVAGTRKEQTGELGFGHSFPGLWFEGGGLAGGQGQHGLTAYTEINFAEYWSQLEARRLWDLPQEKAKEKKDYKRDEQELYLTGLQRGYYTASLNRPLWQGSGAIRYTRREDSQKNHNMTSVSYYAVVYRTGANSLSMNLDLGRSDEKLSFRCTLSWHFSERNWSNRIASGYSRENPKKGGSNSSSEFAVQAGWRNYDAYRDDNLAWSMGAKARDSQMTADGRFEYGGHLGHGSFYAAHQESSKTKGTSYSLQMSTSLTADSHGLAVGGADQGGNSAIVVSIPGAGKEDKFQVLVNGYPYGFARGGAKTVVPLPAFTTYLIAVRPVTDAMFEGVERSEKITLYPGNVKSLTFKVWRRKIVIGRLTDPEGKILPHLCGKFGNSPVCTNEFGLFQAEGRGGDKVIFTGENIRCQIPVQDRVTSEPLLDMGDVVCRDDSGMLQEN